MEHVLISIVAPETMEDLFTSDLRELGVKGWTAWTVRGAGEHGVRPSRWSGSNVRIDLVVEKELGQKVVSELGRKHPRSRAVFVTSTPAQVLVTE